MIYNVEIINEYQNFYEILTHELVGDEKEVIKLCKIKKNDILSDIKIFREIEIKNKLNEGVIKLC